MSIMAKTPSGYKKIGSAYLGERPVDKVFNANGDVVYALQRELTGVPPLLFKGKEQSELLNYRMYGDTVDGNGVGDLVESGEHAGEYKVPVTVEGKNLIDVKNLSFYRNNNEKPTEKVDESNTRIKSDIFPLINKHPFIVVSGIPSMLRLATIRYYDSDLRRIVESLSVEIPQNTSYVSLLFKDEEGGITDETKTLLQNSKLQVEYGVTPTPYEPYHAPVTTPIYLPEPIKMVGDEAEYIDYAEQKLHRVRKNLLQNTATSQTKNGVTFTVNSDGSVTCNGTATAMTVFNVNAILTLPVGEFILTGSPTGGSFNSSYYLYVQTDNTSPQKFYHDIGNGVTINNTSADIVYSTRIAIERGYSINNQTFYPMLRLASIADDTYEPYIENTELGVTLPALPTLAGTNTLSIDTTVQPSRMDIKGRIKTLT